LFLSTEQIVFIASIYTQLRSGHFIITHKPYVNCVSAVQYECGVFNIAYFMNYEALTKIKANTFSWSVLFLVKIETFTHSRLQIKSFESKMAYFTK